MARLARIWPFSARGQTATACSTAPWVAPGAAGGTGTPHEPLPPVAARDRGRPRSGSEELSGDSGGSRRLLDRLRGKRPSEVTAVQKDNSETQAVVQEHLELWRRRHFLSTHGGAPTRRMPVRDGKEDPFATVFRKQVIHGDGGGDQDERWLVPRRRELAPLHSSAVGQRIRGSSRTSALGVMSAERAASSQASSKQFCVATRASKPLRALTGEHREAPPEEDERWAFSRQTSATRCPDEESISCREAPWRRIPSYEEHCHAWESAM